MLRFNCLGERITVAMNNNDKPTDANKEAYYQIALWAAQRFGSAFPYGTLIVNLAGCFAIAAVMHTALTLSCTPRSPSASRCTGSAPRAGTTPKCRAIYT